MVQAARGFTPQTNRFYFTSVLSNEAVLQSDFGDLPSQEGSGLLVLSKAEENRYLLLSGSTDNTVPYGDYTLDGAYLSMYVSGTTLAKSSGVPPNLSLWAVDGRYPISGGSFTFATADTYETGGQVGDKLVVFNNQYVGPHIYKTDDFSGDAAAVLKFPSLTVTSKGYHSTFKTGTTGPSFTHFILLDDWARGAGMYICNMDAATYTKYQGSFMDLFERADMIDISGVESKILRVTADNNHYYLDVSYMGEFAQDLPALKASIQLDYAQWVYVNDTSDNPAWGGALGFTVDENAGEVLTPSTNSTIFDTFKSTANYTNPYNETDTNPLVTSVTEITSDGSQSGGGQALRFYHNWGGSTHYADTTTNSLVEKYIGKANDVSPQVSMAGIYNLPMPVTYEVGHDLRGDRRTIVPEISVDMRIDKLPPTPRWAIEQSASGGTTTWGAVDQTTGLYYDNTAASFDITTTGATDAGYIDWGNDSLTTLRSVAIVFSNYKPKDTHKTLDDFLNYGMYGAYYDGNTSEGIVGGIIIRTLDIDGETDEDNAFAYATSLGTTRNIDLNAPYGTDNTQSGYDSVTTAGDVGYFGMGRFLSGTLNTPTSFGPHTIQQRPLFNSTNRGTGKQPAAGSGSEREVAIPMNTYFNMRFFIDAQATNWTGSNSLSPYRDFPRGSTPSGGVGIRCIFDTQEATGDGEAGQSPSEDLKFLDIPFPVGEVNSAVTDIPTYNFGTNSFNQPEGSIVNTRRLMYPKHMTIWVQNYRWIKGSTSNGSWFKMGDDTIYTEPTTAMETEVFVDNITLSNFTPPVYNLSAPQDNYFRGAFANTTYRSPLYTITGTQADTTVRCLTAWVSGTGYTSPGPTFAQTTASYHQVSPGNYLMFGLGDKTWLPKTSTDARYGYIHMSDFATGDWANLNQMVPALSSGAIFSVAASVTTNSINYLGYQFQGASYRTSGTGTDPITTQAGSCVVGETMVGETNMSGFALGTGANTIYSHDGFTQKGFMQIYVSGASGVYPGYTDWGNREHILASTKVTSVADMNEGLDDFSIEVQDTTIFTKNLDDEYIIYMYGEPDSTTTRLGVSTSLKLAGDTPITGNIVKFSSSVANCDSAVNALCKEEFLSQLWISPKKYWTTIIAKNDSTWATRTFGQFCLVDEVPSDSDNSQLGSTWNEWQYHYNTADEGTIGKAAVYTNTWDLRSNTTGSMLITDYDFGHGVLSGSVGGYIDSIPAVRGYFSTLNMKGMVDWMGKGKNTFTQFLKLDGYVNNKATIVTSNHATSLYHPMFIYEYLDPLPEVASLNVTPTYDLLTTGTNVYELTRENLNSVTFSWDETSDDTWYRYFIISPNGINNKYATCRIHVPLNNSPASFAERATFTATDPVSGTSLTVDSTGSSAVSYVVPYSRVNGLAGYAPHFTDTASEKIRVLGTNALLSGATTMSTVIHAIPDNSADATTHILYSAGAGGPSLGSSAGVFCALVANKLVYDQKGLSAALTGSTFIPYDGITPVNVIVLFDEDKAGPFNLNIYVNGVLEMSAAGAEPPTGTPFNDVITGSLYIGGYYNNNHPFHGKIEEFVYYDSALEVSERAGEHQYNTVDTLDITGTTNITHNARLFVFDYHNIRGNSVREVAMSNQTKWRATTL